MSTNPVGVGRRRFLMGAAGVAAVPLVAGMTGCAAGAQPTPPGPTSANGNGANPVTAATTVTGRRRIGSLEVSNVGLGCQTMTGRLYGPVTSRDDMVKIIRTAADQGVTLFDTAETYGPFESERIVGDALQPVRDQVVIETKFGWDIDPDTGQMRGGLNSRPDQIRRAVDGMLQRLRTDRIDVLLQHPGGPDGAHRGRGGHREGPDHTGQGPLLRALRAGTRDRPPRPCGPAAHCDPERVLHVVAGAGDADPAAVRGTRDRVRRLGTPQHPGEPGRQHAARRAAAGLGVRKGATPAQLSLAWLRAQKPWIVPIPSITRTPHLLEDLGADDVTFTPDELQELATALDGITIHGERLLPPVLALSGVEAPPKA